MKTKAVAERQGSSFRGYWSIMDVKLRTERLCISLDLLGKPSASIALAPTDYDLIRRWPKAAAMCEFDVTQGGMTFRGHPVIRHVGVGRYE